MIKWFRRRKYRECMRDIFRLSQSFIANCNKDNRNKIIDALAELIDDYENKYGVDNISLRYRSRLDYFRIIGRVKE